MKQFLQLIRPFREMRKIVVLCLAMVMSMGAAWGQTTVTQTSFASTSGSVNNDTYVSYAAYKGGGTSNPAVNTNAIRLYQNSSGQTGGYVVIGVAEGYVITSATIQSTMATTTGYILTDEDPGSSTPAKSSFNVSNYSLSANTDYTVSGISTRYITFACFGTTSSTRLYLSKISVTYQEAGGNTLTATTTTINSTGITNTDVYVNTTAGSLSATVTPEGGSALANPTITWSSSNTGVATIDASGVVTLVSAGTTTITASYPGEENQYTSSSATYELTVTSSEPYEQPTTIEANLNNSLFGTSYNGSVSNLTDDNPVIGTIDNVTVTYAGSGNHYINNSQIRFYPNNKLTFDAPSGYEITEIVFTSAGTWAATISANTGTYTSGTKTWAGSASSVLFTGSGSSRCDMSKATITIVPLGNAVATTTTVDATGITNTDVYTGTDAGLLSATVTVSEGGAVVPDASVIWSGNNDAVATIDAATGEVTLVGAGSVTFTASYAGVEDEYLASSGTYEMTVTNNDPNAPGTVNNPYTVAQAIAFIDGLGGSTSTEKYVSGIISQIDNYNSNYSSITYWISDDGTTTNQLEVYSGKGINGADFSSINDIEVGAEVVVKGNLKKYNSTYEFDYNNELVVYNGPQHDVEAPTFSPAAGTYAEAQDVTISCATEGADIYYTLDGTDPTMESTMYENPLTVNGTTTIKAVAYDGNDTPSNVTAANYYFCSADDPYTVTDALAFAEYQYPANGIYVTGIVSTAPTQAPTNNGELTYYISVDGEATGELEVYKGKGLNEAAFTAQDDIQVGDIVTIYGNVVIYGTSNPIKEFAQGNYLVSLVRPAVPSITVAPATVDATSEGAEGSLTITYENIPDLISFDIQFCDANGDELAGDDPDWIYAGIEGDEGNYTIDYTIDANEAAARTAYFKVYTSVGGNNVYSNLVIINQAKFQLDYATLPFEWGGGASVDFLDLNGVTAQGLGSDYASSYAPYLIKFDGTGDYIQVKCDQQPDKVTIKVKMIGGSNTSTITVQGSADGVTFTDVDTLEISGSQNDTLTLETTNAFANTDRYVRLLFTKGSNVGVGPISIALPVANPSVTVAPATIDAPAEGANGTFTVTYEDLGDAYDADVEFFEENGVTPATYDWIHVNVNAENNVEYGIDANTGVARTAYMKVVSTYGDNEEVYSNLVTISQAAPTPVTVTITGHTSTLDYDGNEHSVSDYDVTAIEIDGVATELYTENDFTFSGTASAARTVAGTTYMGLTSNMFINTNANFSVTFAVTDGYLTIEKASMTVNVTGATDSKTYNGSEQSVTGYSLSCESSLYDETLVSYSGTAEAKGTTVGTYPMNLDAEQFSYGNININVSFNIVSDGGLEITAATMTVNVTGTTDSKTYNGVEQSVTGYSLSSESSLYDETLVSYSGTAEAKGTTVGTYPMNLDAEQFSYGNSNINVSFNIVSDGGLEITAATMTVNVTGATDSKTYNGSEQSVTGYAAVSESALFDEELVTISSEAKASGTEAGTYPMGLNETMFGYSDTNIVVTFSVTDGGLTIAKATMAVTVTGNTETKTYNGSEQSVTGYVAASESALFDEELVTVSSEAKASGTEAGTYPMGLNETMFGYSDTNIVVTFSVTDGWLEILPPCGITLDENNEWSQNFDNLTTSTEKWTGKTMGIEGDCWTWTRLVELPEGYLDTVPQIYYNSNFAHESNYSLRLHFRGVYAMPELDESINLNDLKMSFYLRQSYSFYTLLVGVMNDPTDPTTFVPVAHVDNGTSTGVEYVEVNFANYQGEGRYIAFKNVRPTATEFDGNWGDIHSVNYIDNLTLSLKEEGDCVVGLPYEMNFEEVTHSTNALTGAMPECWEMVQNDLEEEIPFDKMPQVYCKASLANNGNYSLRMYDRCVYAMPMLADTVDMSKVQLSMSVRQPNARYQLYVGVWSDGEFYPVALVNNESTGYEDIVCDFSNYDGPAGRIAFRNVLSKGKAYDYSYNYIDDIVVSYTGGASACDAVTSLNVTETFEDYTQSTVAATGVKPTCWEVVDADVEMAYDKYPQVYYNPNFGQGSYTLRMADRCVFAMPELEDGIELSDVTLTMTLRQPNTQYQLEVGVWEEGPDGYEFVPVKTIHNTDNTVTEVSCDFASYTGNGTRIAFHNTLKTANYNYSYNYLDDITLTLTESKIAESSNANVIDEIGVERYLEGIVVYPNPTVGELHISAVDVQKVECYNQMGQLVAVYNNDRDINISTLADGVYTLRITVPQGVTMRKVVKR